MKHYILLFVFLGQFLSTAFAQQNIDEMRKRLQSIQKEIESIQADLESAKNELAKETSSIEKLDKQTNLIHQKISIYNKEVSIKRKRIGELEVQIDSLKQKETMLQSIFRKQVVFAYKYRRGKHLDWMLGAGNFNKALIRYRYFRKISSVEKGVYDDLVNLKSDLSEKQDDLGREIKNLSALRKSANTEEKNLKTKRSEKSKLVKKIRQNKTLLSQALNEKQESYKKLSNLIARLEREKGSRNLKTETQIRWENLTGNFHKNKGKLNWPVTGRILHNFGKYKTELKTVLNNTGIDIAAPRGNSVRCIFSGVVSMITYLGGFGNTIIVDHNDGYYTVYSHLDQIVVNENSFVEAGATLGTVGESGSFEGPKLHFEIYGDFKPLNPLEWLKKF
jgi:septal ring factor EnvC (AmiA/AmiB activator)